MPIGVVAQISRGIDDDRFSATLWTHLTNPMFGATIDPVTANAAVRIGGPSLPGDLSDHDLLVELERATSVERQANACLIALMWEVDSRKLYAGQGYSSLFTYCVQRLHLSEHAAYLRIETARSARRFPTVLDRLADGSLHLTAVGRMSLRSCANCQRLRLR